MICIVDGQILDEGRNLIRFMTLKDADSLIRKRAEQSETAANYVKAVDEDDKSFSESPKLDEDIGIHNRKVLREKFNSIFQNGVGFDNGNGLWFHEQGFAIGGQERLSRSNGYLVELAAAVFVCRVCLFSFDLFCIVFFQIYIQYMNSYVFNSYDNMICHLFQFYDSILDRNKLISDYLFF